MNLKTIWRQLIHKKNVIISSTFTRYFKFAILSIFLAIALINCTPQESIPLRIGSNLWPGYETLYLARDLGYYDKTPIRLVDYPSGTEEVRAFRNNEIEGAGLSIDQALTLAATQGNIKIIAIMDISNGGDAILGKPEITDFKALKGKKVGVESTALGAFILARALEENEMKPSDITIVSLELTEHEKAYQEGTVDAVVTFGKPMINLLDNGAKILFDSSKIPGEIVDILAVSTEAIANSPKTIQALVDGRFKALNYFEENPQDAASRMAKRTQITPEKMLKSFDGLHQPNLQDNQKLLDQTDPTFINGVKKLVEVMLENKLLPQSIEPSSIIDSRFVENAKI